MYCTCMASPQVKMGQIVKVVVHREENWSIYVLLVVLCWLLIRCFWNQSLLWGALLSILDRILPDGWIELAGSKPHMMSPFHNFDCCYVCVQCAQNPRVRTAAAIIARSRNFRDKNAQRERARASERVSDRKAKFRHITHSSIPSQKFIVLATRGSTKIQ